MSSDHSGWEVFAFEVGTAAAKEAAKQAAGRIAGGVGDLMERNSYVLKVYNKTKFTMRRIEAHNDSEHWPIGDVAAGQVMIAGLNRKNFSFAARYSVPELNYQVILAASSPLIGTDKIDIQSPCEGIRCVDVWDRMDDGNDKSARSARAILLSTEVAGAKVWEWHIEP